MNISEVYRRFPTEGDCVAYLEEIRWQGTSNCPYCETRRVTPSSAGHRHHCNTTFPVTVGTPFHHTHLPLQKWFFAIYLILNARKGISARRLSRRLAINKNTAWYLATRVRKAVMEPSQRALLQKIDSELYDLANSRTLGIKP